MNNVTLGIIGAGRACELHLNAYRKVHSIEVCIKYICDTDIKRAEKFKKTYKLNCKITDDLNELLKDQEVDAIDICTPPYAHKDLIISSFKHHKHVICEKPLCGYFGDGNTDKKVMLRSVLKDIKELEKAINTSDKQFFYAENFIYAPAIIRTAQILKTSKSKILFAKGEESLAGSSSEVAGLWEKTGGGSLIRVGCHPLSAIIYLKKISDPNITIKNIKADIGNVTNNLTKNEHKYIKANPVDVEDTALVSLTFSDDSKALIIANDTRLGGSRNYVELYCNDSFYECNLTMNNLLKTYMIDDNKFKNIELSEMLQTNIGWNNPFVEDEIIRGYANEMQDFIECIAYNKKPESGFDIAKETIKTIYTAYSKSN